MIKRPTTGLLALALAATLAGTAHAAPSARLLAGNGEASGEITAAAPMNYSDGSRSQLYSLQLAAGQAVQLKLDGALNGMISVFHRNALVARSSANDSGSTRLGVQADKAGQYLVAVSGADARSFGPYTLSVEPIQAYDGQPLVAGRHVTDWLRSGKRSYPMQVDTLGIYTIDLRSDEFDATLTLSGNGLILRDDDGGEGTNSRLVAALKPGSYTLDAGSYGETNGAFHLEVQHSEIADDVVLEDGSSLPLDGSVTSLISGDETRHFVLDLPEARQVQLDATSDTLDTYLTLQGADLTLSNDDGGNGVDARLVQVLEAGQYNVSVRTVNSRGGSFRLTTRTTPAQAGAARPQLSLGREAQGRLAAGQRDLYTLEIPRKGRYSIALNGMGDLDGMLTLLRDGQEIASQDDTDDSLDPLLEVQLDAGRYLLMVHSYDPGAEGAYKLLARRR